MRRGRRSRPATLIVVATIAAALALGSPAGADDDDADRLARLAETQFRTFLEINTDLVPSDVTCTRPPGTDTSQSLVCFALVDGRQTVAASAVLVAPGTYSFVAITKASAAPATAPAAADTATAAAIDSAVADIDGLTAYLAEAEPAVVSVDSLSYDPSTVTVQLVVTTTSTDQAARDQAAWFLTDTMAYLWEAGRPLRDEASTIDPRLEVIVDGVVYGTPYDVMVDVADYQIGFDQWLAISNPPVA